MKSLILILFLTIVITKKTLEDCQDIELENSEGSKLSPIQVINLFDEKIHLNCEIYELPHVNYYLCQGIEKENNPHQLYLLTITENPKFAESILNTNQDLSFLFIETGFINCQKKGSKIAILKTADLAQQFCDFIPEEYTEESYHNLLPINQHLNLEIYSNDIFNHIDRRKKMSAEKEGGYGKIIYDDFNNRNYLVKIIDRDYATITEAKLSALFPEKSKPGVPLQGCFFDSEKVYLFFQNQGIDLLRDFEKFKKINSFPIRFKTYLSMTQQVNQLHKLGYIHNDIKPSNFLLDHTHNVVSLIDFGLAEEINSPETLRGDPYFMRPTRAQNELNVESNDVYSLAMTFLFLEFGKSYDIFKEISEERKIAIEQRKIEDFLMTTIPKFLANFFANDFENALGLKDQSESYIEFAKYLERVILSKEEPLKIKEMMELLERLYQTEEKILEKKRAERDIANKNENNTALRKDLKNLGFDWRRSNRVI